MWMVGSFSSFFIHLRVRPLFLFDLFPFCFKVVTSSTFLLVKGVRPGILRFPGFLGPTPYGSEIWRCPVLG